MSNVNLSQFKRQIKLVIIILRNCQGLFFKTLRLEETGDLSVLLVWYRGKQFVCSIKITTHNSCLILKNGERNLVRHNVEGLVNHEDTVFLGKVSKDSVLRGTGRICFHVDKGLDLSADTVIQTSNVVNVDETVSYPLSGKDVVVYLVKKVKTSVNTIFGRNTSHGDSLRSHFGVEGKYISRSFTGDQHHVASFRPVYFLRRDINLAHESTAIPVVKENRAIASFNSNHVTSEQAFSCSSGRNDRLGFLEVFEDFHVVHSLTNGVVTSSRPGPHKVECLPESLVTERLSGVNNEFSVTTYGNKATVTVVSQHLREEFTRAQITRDNGKAFTIRNGIFVGAGDPASGSRLDFVILGPYNFTRGIHRSNRIIRSEFNAHATFVKANGQLVSIGRSSQSPGTLHSIVQGRFRTVRGALPDADSTIFRCGSNNGQLGVEQHSANIVRVSVEGMNN
mmetsp:Transcript_15495/g.29589  ORF Transcript_15495/g.29589 Transcript_15495/m.29589 type:complete len:451 (+) Transcript_15495:856-2208(+)